MCDAGACSNCGAMGDPCCQGACQGGLVCAFSQQGQTCQACGDNEQRCCADRTCADGGACIGGGNGTCFTDCGTPGTACCPGNGGQCGTGAVCNDDDMCEACGTSGQACCPGAGPGTDGCTGDLRCSLGMCAACGAANQPCCRTGFNGNTLSCDQGLTCDAQFTCVEN